MYLLILSVFHSAISYNITSIGVHSSKLVKDVAGGEDGLEGLK